MWATTGEPQSEESDESKSEDKAKSEETDDYASPKSIQVVFCGFNMESKPVPLTSASEPQFQPGKMEEFKVS